MAKQDTKGDRIAKAVGTMGIGVALAVVITQVMSAHGIDYAETLTVPIAVIAQGLIHEVRLLIGDRR